MQFFWFVLPFGRKISVFWGQQYYWQITDPVDHSLSFPSHRVILGSLDPEVLLASMAAMAPLGVLAFLDLMGFLAYLDCLYVPTQMCSVVTKPGFAFCDIVGEVTAKYFGRT